MTATATRREWIGLAVLTLPCLLAVMDLTVLGLVLPQLSATLEPTGAQLLWIVAFTASCWPVRSSRWAPWATASVAANCCSIGATAFGVASMLAAFSTSPAMLIAMRAILGIAGATLVPSSH